MKLFVLLSFCLCFVVGQEFAIALQYDDCSSNNNLQGFAVTRLDAGKCVASACGCTFDGNYCTEVRCNQTRAQIPADPPNSVIYKEFSDTDCNSQDLRFEFAGLSGACIVVPGIQGYTNPAAYKQSCQSKVLRYRKWDNANDCSGNANDDYPLVVGSSFCASSSTAGESFSYNCTNPACIQVDAELTYKGEKHSFKNLPEECTVPHTVTQDGVKITTGCPGVLRLTHEHLVMTVDGWKEAGTIKVGDILFSEIEGSKKCVVEYVEAETDQQYSGLNCVESDILANGHWISTFGITHQIPALWMKYASKVLGIQTASTVGDYIGNMLYKFF